MQNLIDRILDEYKTDDLSDSFGTAGAASVANFIMDAIYFYQRDNFFQGESSSDQATTAGTASYNLPTDYVSMTAAYFITGGTIYPLQQILHQDLVTLDSNTASPTRGKGTYYSIYNSQIRIFPTPDSSSDTVRMIYQSRPAEPTAVGDSNFWTTTAEELIRYRAKWLINMAVFRDPQMAQMDKELEMAALRKIMVDTKGKLYTGTLKAWHG